MDLSSYIPEALQSILLVAVIVSSIVMLALQKVKELKFMQHDVAIWVANLILSGAITIPFARFFFGLSLEASIWAAVLTFLGAPTLFKLFKTFTPDTIEQLTTK